MPAEPPIVHTERHEHLHLSDDPLATVAKMLGEMQEKQGGGSKMQWIAVVGVGTVLLLAIVPWMMNLISGTLTQNTAAVIKLDASIDANTESNKRIAGEFDDLSDVMRDMLNRVELKGDVAQAEQ